MSWPEPGDIAKLKHPATTWGSRRPPFNAAAVCPKCAGEDVYASHAMSRYDCETACRAEHDEEHMHRGCRRCGFRWIEAPLDVVSGPDGTTNTQVAEHE